MRRIAAGAALVLVLSGLVGCAPALSETGEPLTVGQSERLASARFAVFAKGPFVADVSFLAADDVEHVAATLTVDPEEHRAWGEFARGPEDLAVTEPVLVTPAALVVQHEGRWRAADVSDTARLAVQGVFALVADRPENAQLLRQSDAAYLGTTDETGERLEVYRLPSPDDTSARTRLWLTPDGALRRIDGGAEGSLVIELPGGPVSDPPAGADEVWRALEG